MPENDGQEADDNEIEQFGQRQKAKTQEEKRPIQPKAGTSWWGRAGCAIVNPDNFQNTLLAVFIGLLALFTFGLIVVGMLQKWTLDDQRAVLDKTDKTLQAEQRPWVYFAARNGYAVSGDFTYDANGGNIGVTFDVVNTGHSPAIYTQVLTGGFIMDKGRRPLEQQKALCDLFDHRAIDTTPGYTLFPGQDFAQPTTITFPRDQIESEHQRMKFIMPVIVGCFFYVAARAAAINQDLPFRLCTNQPMV